MKKYGIFVQPYFKECDKTQMVGTKKFPCYLVGDTDKLGKNGEFIAYYTGNGKPENMILDTDIIKIYHKMKKCNILIGKKYLIGVSLPIKVGNLTPVRDGNEYLFCQKWKISD